MGYLASYSPITLEEVGRVETTEPDDVSIAAARCRAAQKIWDGYSTKIKLDHLKRLRLNMAKNIDRIAYTVYLETGKPKVEGYNSEVLASISTIAYCEKLLKDFNFKVILDQGPMSTMVSFMNCRSYVEYRPLGLIGVISPYNFPFSIPFTEVISAIAAGNGVLLKPSSETPLTGFLIATLFEEAGFPKDLVMPIAGKGTGPKVISCSDKVIFTGSTETGISVMESTSKTLIPAVLELGGKDAMLVLDDADIKRAAEGATWGAFLNSGQVCVGVKRIYIHNSRYDEFISEYISRVKALKQGDGWNDPDVSVGPMINEVELEKMCELVKEMVAAGAKVLTGGKKADMKGCFFEPTVIIDLPTDSELAAREVFGPVVCLFKMDSDEDGIEKANNCPFALGGSVWTRDLDRGYGVAVKIYAGTVDVNNAIYTFGLPASPWGGRGLSGFGTTHSQRGFTGMMYPHHVHVDKGNYSHDPWWMPYNDEKTRFHKDLINTFFGNGRGMLAVVSRFMKIRK